jgi:hypothetical protein
MIFTHLTQQTNLRDAITNAYRMDETACLASLLSQATLDDMALHRIAKNAKAFVIGTQERRKKQGKIDAFLQQYDLSSEEGIALMCLAEALLRIPDKTTVDRLISDKISTADWRQRYNILVTDRENFQTNTHHTTILKCVISTCYFSVRKCLDSPLSVARHESHGKSVCYGENHSNRIRAC